jgi:RNA polymerase sigma factor (sigma-70 family)
VEAGVQDWQVLVVSAQGGDLAAFEQIVRRFQDMAVGYAYSLLGDFPLAQDAAQEALIEGYCKLGMLREPRAFPAWLRRIVFQQCDRLTRGKRPPLQSLEAAGDVADRRQGPLAALEQQELHDAVLAALRALPEHERTTTTLFYIDGYSLGEVGEFLEVPVGTVKKRLHSARKRLRERMVEVVEDTLKQHAPGDELSRRVTRILEGITRIHWTTTSVLCFVGAVVACMNYLGEPVESDYVIGISGGAFKLFWYPGWSGASCDLLMYGEEPIRRTFTALGYDYRYLKLEGRERVNWDPPATPEWARSRKWAAPLIVAAIDAGKPVIAQGIIGPPECSVVAGYDRGGEVLYGRSYFQQDPEGYFHLQEWYCPGLILIGEKRQPPPARTVLRDTLTWAIRLAREPAFDADPAGNYWSGPLRHLSGLAAYDGIAAALERDEEYPAGNLEVLTFRAMALGNDGVHLLRCKRDAAAHFLRTMAATDLPCASELLQAAEAYEQEVPVVEAATHITPWSFGPEEERLRLADPELRRKLAVLVREARVHEERAVEHLEAALAALG